MKNFGFAAFAAGLVAVLLSCADPTGLQSVKDQPP